MNHEPMSRISSMANRYAQSEYFDYRVYTALHEQETNPEFKAILGKLIGQELADYRFWGKYANEAADDVPLWKIKSFLLMRKFLWLTFTAKFLENRERHTADEYERFMNEVDDPELKSEVSKIISHEREHEGKFISSIKEERLEFMGNVVLWLNDWLIELTGALTGFAFALRNPEHTAVLGLITGVAAAFSMAASAAMQAKYEDGKDPITAAIYTGWAYAIVVFLLVAPFFLFSEISASLTLMAVNVLLIIACITSYWSVLFDRPFRREFGLMLGLSIGVALLTFGLGTILKSVFGLG